jgi:hypothetical protein
MAVVTDNTMPAERFPEQGAARTCVVLQPGYLPWLGFFEQMHRADVFVYLDDVQFDKHGWRNRNRIKGPGGPQWLTVPVRLHGLHQPTIREVCIDDAKGGWARKHMQALQTNYGRCPHFDWMQADLEGLLLQGWTSIADLDIALTSLLCAKLGLSRSILRTSSMNLPADRCARLIDICRAVGCNRYYSGAAARDYLDVGGFAEAGIEVAFQDYHHPTYPQRYGDFVSHLSVVDLMYNVGPASLAVILAGARDCAGATGEKACTAMA